MNINNSNINYSNINYSNTNPNIEKVWYSQYRGYIIKNWIEKGTNKIKQEKLEYNQPNNFLGFLNNYFTYKLK